MNTTALTASEILTTLLTDIESAIAAGRTSTPTPAAWTSTADRVREALVLLPVAGACAGSIGIEGEVYQCEILGAHDTHSSKLAEAIWRG